MRWFTQKEVNKVFSHIPARTLRWWVLMGFYKWAAEFPDGRGISREYHVGNLYQIGIVEELSSLNIPTRIIKQIMDSHFSGESFAFPLELPQETDNLGNKEEDLDEFGPIEMEDVLVIRKGPRGSEAGKRARGDYDWVSDLIRPDEIYDDKIGQIERSHTMILVDLKDIRKWIDSRVAQV
jgi:hypothetical protein